MMVRAKPQHQSKRLRLASLDKRPACFDKLSMGQFGALPSGGVTYKSPHAELVEACENMRLPLNAWAGSSP
jgi:hypothetical protein